MFLGGFARVVLLGDSLNETLKAPAFVFRS